MEKRVQFSITAIQLRPLEAICDFHVSQDWFPLSIYFTLDHVEYVLCLLDSTFQPLYLPPPVGEPEWTEGVRGERGSGNLLCLLTTPDESLSAIVKQM